MKIHRVWFGVSFSLLLSSFTHTATAASLQVDAKANIFRPGAQAPGDGILPPGLSFSSAANQTLTFSSVTGTITCTAGVIPNPPDGSCGPAGTNIQSVANNGIAGVRHNSRNMFLVGLFLDNATPTGTPSQVDLSGQELQETIVTSLAVPFYIGDGFTENAQQQKFLVPSSATRVFFGFADAFDFNGLPDFYNDNSGSLTVDFDIQQSSNSIPTPFILPSLLIFSAKCLRRKKERCVRQSFMKS